MVQKMPPKGKGDDIGYIQYNYVEYVDCCHVKTFTLNIEMPQGYNILMN